MVPLKSTGSCWTSCICVRSQLTFRFLVSIPSSNILPVAESYQRSRSPTIVLFPEPLAPTSAVVFPSGALKVKPFRTYASGRDEYANRRSCSSIAPAHWSGFRPSVDRESIADSLSIMRKSSSAAAAALVIVIIWGAMCVRDVAATTTAKITLLIDQQ